jgi:hypothetical protein
MRFNNSQNLVYLSLNLGPTLYANCAQSLRSRGGNITHIVVEEDDILWRAIEMLYNVVEC